MLDAKFLSRNCRLAAAITAEIGGRPVGRNKDDRFLYTRVGRLFIQSYRQQARSSHSLIVALNVPGGNHIKTKSAPTFSRPISLSRPFLLFSRFLIQEGFTASMESSNYMRSIPKRQSPIQVFIDQDWAPG